MQADRFSFPSQLARQCRGARSGSSQCYNYSIYGSLRVLPHNIATRVSITLMYTWISAWNQSWECRALSCMQLQLQLDVLVIHFTHSNKFSTMEDSRICRPEGSTLVKSKSCFLQIIQQRHGFKEDVRQADILMYVGAHVIIGCTEAQTEIWCRILSQSQVILHSWSVRRILQFFFLRTSTQLATLTPVRLTWERVARGGAWLVIVPSSLWMVDHKETSSSVPLPSNDSKAPIQRACTHQRNFSGKQHGYGTSPSMQ